MTSDIRRNRNYSERNLEGLSRVLKVKLFFTAIFWSIPLLTFPASWFLAVGLPAPEPIIFARLLGAAYLALIVGYSFGLVEINKGKKPTQVVWMGITSNGLACAILVYHGLTGGWSTWSIQSQVLMWASALATLGITVLLFRYGHP